MSRLRLVLVCAALFLVSVGLLATADRLADPFGRRAARLALAETAAATAREHAAARQLETEGARELARRSAEAGRLILETRVATAQAAAHARSAPDADNPLDPDRSARLRAHDRRLCELAPAACDAAATGDAGAGGRKLPADGLAPGAQRG